MKNEACNFAWELMHQEDTYKHFVGNSRIQTLLQMARDFFRPGKMLGRERTRSGYDIPIYNMLWITNTIEIDGYMAKYRYRGQEFLELYERPSPGKPILPRWAAPPYPPPQQASPASASSST